MIILLPIFLVALAMAAIFAFISLLICSVASALTGVMLLRTGLCLRRGDRNRGLMLAFTGMGTTSLLMVSVFAIAGYCGHYSYWTHLFWLPTLSCAYGVSAVPVDILWTLAVWTQNLFRGNVGKTAVVPPRG